MLLWMVSLLEKPLTITEYLSAILSSCRFSVVSFLCPTSRSFSYRRGLYCLDDGRSLDKTKRSKYAERFHRDGERVSISRDLTTPPLGRSVVPSGDEGPLGVPSGKFLFADGVISQKPDHCKIDYSARGMWLIHPKVLDLYSQYRIFFRKGTRSYKNWTVPASRDTTDHSQCERVKEHAYCRVSAEITDIRATKVHKFESVAMHQISPHPPMKNKRALVVDVRSPFLGRAFKVERFRDRTMRVAQVLDCANDLLEFQTNQLTLAEEILEP